MRILDIWSFSQFFKNIISANKKDNGRNGDNNTKSFQPNSLSNTSISITHMLFIETKAKALLIASLLSLSFFIAYILLQPANFGAFSETIPYFISGLATLLAIVISLNSFSMQNESNSMASNLKRLDEELDNIGDLLGPLKPAAENSKTAIFSNATRYATEAIYKMIRVTLNRAEQLSNNNVVDNDHDLKSIYLEFVEESMFRISLFCRTHSIYSLATISTTDFIIRLRFKAITADADKTVKEFFDSLRRLHVIRNIASTIFIRHNIANLSYELLFSSIPIIILTAAISFTFSYEENDPIIVRLVYSGTFSAVTLPFIFFAARTIPLVHLTKSNSGLPFSHR